MLVHVYESDRISKKRKDERELQTVKGGVEDGVGIFEKRVQMNLHRSKSVFMIKAVLLSEHSRVIQSAVITGAIEVASIMPLVKMLTSFYVSSSFRLHCKKQSWLKMVVTALWGKTNFHFSKSDKQQGEVSTEEMTSRSL